MTTPSVPAGPSSAAAVLARIAAARPPAVDGERCEMCGTDITDDHRHVVHLGSRRLLCTCRPCGLLFAHDAAQLQYRAVPDRYLSFPDLPSGLWDDLQIPVGLAFLFRNSALDRTVAFYPGPAGATESELPLGAWDDAVSRSPALTALRPDVEALLLRAPERQAGVGCWLVPIDRPYELVGRMRQVWRGFDGGQEARVTVAAFFADVAGRARPARTPVP